MTDESAGIGHNRPPSDEPQAITDARNVWKAIAAWLESNPVVDSEELAQQATQHRSNGQNALKALEEARAAECDPLRTKWENARERWRPSIEALGGNSSKKKPKAGIIQLVADRLAAYMRAEEAKRQAALAEARKREREAEEAARKAEEAEKEAIENAKVGECVDVAAVTLEADRKFDMFEDASAKAAQAARDAKVRTRGAFDERATALRTKETLVVTDRFALAQALAPEYGAEIDEALLTLVRKFRAQHKVLPAGVKAELEKVL